MTTRCAALITGAALVGLVGSPLLATSSAVHAATRVAQDPCVAPLPLQPTYSSGVGTLSTLQGGGYTFRLFQFAAPGLREELRQLGARPLPGDNVATFSFALPNGGHRYDGLTHVFHSGAGQQVCYRGAAYVDGGNSAAFIAHPRTATIRLDGTIVGGRARMDVSVGNAHYYVFGQVRNR